MKKTISSVYVGSVHHSQLAMTIPFSYAAPTVPTICSLETLVATNALPIIHHGSFPDARKYPSAVSARRRDDHSTTAITIARDRTTMSRSSAFMRCDDQSRSAALVT